MSPTAEPAPSPFPAGRYRGGIPLPGSPGLLPCYLPQYDTLCYPTPFIEDCDNQPSIEAVRRDPRAYLYRYEHELGHRALNFRTVVGFVHFTFTFLKIHCLCYRFPVMKDPGETYRLLVTLDERAAAFFDATKAWDEAYAVLYTGVMAEVLGMPSEADDYRTSACEHYPFIKEYIGLVQVLSDRIADTPEKKALFLASLFDSAAAIEPWPVFEWEPAAGRTLPLNQNVDLRLLRMLESCERRVRRSPDCTVAQLAGHLSDDLDETGITIGVQYDAAAFDGLFLDIAERYLDGLLLRGTYSATTRQLLKDMERLLLPVDEAERTGGRPLSTVTIRPQFDKWVPVIRTALLLEPQEVHFDPGIRVDVDIGWCFRGLFVLGSNIDALVWERRFGAAGKSTRILGDSPTLPDTLRAALRGQLPPSALTDVMHDTLKCASAEWVRPAGGPPRHGAPGLWDRLLRWLTGRGAKA